MATPNPASEFPSGEGTRNVPRSDCSLVGDPKCLDTSLNFYFINFCNIRGSAKPKVHLAFCLFHLGGPHEELC
ncbi:hypothetical protein E2C01_088303 [Portunus trituberculatus]|uniref:Uncharacterized protein n=1 Tax=Portunus trituberculatus TaxID=210409 RepID=A0A5B7J5S6_PORTR|nr:hypothetical protein [Portunus trituberculatus]